MAARKGGVELAGKDVSMASMLKAPADSPKMDTLSLEPPNACKELDGKISIVATVGTGSSSIPLPQCCAVPSLERSADLGSQDCAQSQVAQGWMGSRRLLLVSVHISAVAWRGQVPLVL